MIAQCDLLLTRQIDGMSSKKSTQYVREKAGATKIVRKVFK